MIHPTAVVDPNATLAADVEIGPYSIIGAHVEIGAGTKIASHVVIKGPAKIGCNNTFYQFSSIGEDPQLSDLNTNEDSRLEIGDNNTIREFVTIHRGTPKGIGLTKLGDDNMIMAYVHIAHDCIIGNHTQFVNNASLAGHVKVGDCAILGVFVGVHQFCKIGAHSFVTHAAMINQDVLPYIIVHGNVPSVNGINVVGLRRRGFSNAAIKGIKEAFKMIFREQNTTKEVLPKLQELVHATPEIQLFIDSLNEASRGVTR